MVHLKAPAAPSPRERRRRETRAEIVESAARRIAASGFDALTMQRLADDLGFTAGALYRYFPSKDALVLAVLEGVTDRLHDDLVGAYAAVAAARADEPEAEMALLQLLVAAGTHGAFAAGRPEEFRLLALSIGDPSPAAGEGRAVVPTLAKPLGHFERLLEAAATSGALGPGDAPIRGACLWSALHGAVLLGKFGQLGLPAFAPEPQRTQLLGALLVGWGAVPERVTALQQRADRWLARAARASAPAPGA